MPTYVLSSSKCVRRCEGCCRKECMQRVSHCSVEAGSFREAAAKLGGSATSDTLLNPYVYVSFDRGSHRTFTPGSKTLEILKREYRRNDSDLSLGTDEDAASGEQWLREQFIERLSKNGRSDLDNAILLREYDEEAKARSDRTNIIKALQDPQREWQLTEIPPSIL